MSRERLREALGTVMALGRTGRKLITSAQT
jgi:hypothetical protein